MMQQQGMMGGGMMGGGGMMQRFRVQCTNPQLMMLNGMYTLRPGMFSPGTAYQSGQQNGPTLLHEPHKMRWIIFSDMHGCGGNRPCVPRLVCLRTFVVAAPVWPGHLSQPPGEVRCGSPGCRSDAAVAVVRCEFGAGVVGTVC